MYQHHLLMMGERTFQDLVQINHINHEKQQQRQLRKLLGLVVSHIDLEELWYQVPLEIVTLHINHEGQPICVDQTHSVREVPDQHDVCGSSFCTTGGIRGE